jgi:hypothetical protein
LKLEVAKKAWKRVAAKEEVQKEKEKHGEEKEQQWWK